MAGGRPKEMLKEFDENLKINLDLIMKNNDIENYNSLNIAFLKAIDNMESAIFGTKKFDRVVKLEKEIENINPLKKDDFIKILKLQDQYKFHISF